MRPWMIFVCLGLWVAACAARLPVPGSPAALTDWRWLARAPEGVHGIRYDTTGAKLERTPEGAYQVLQLDGPGVVELCVIPTLDLPFAIEADGQILWSGPLRAAVFPAAKSSTPYQPPLAVWCGNAGYLATPIAFRQRLRILCEKDTFPGYFSYRTFPKGTAVEPAVAEPKSAYQQGLLTAAERWKGGAFNVGLHVDEPAKEVTRDFLLPAQSRTTALALKGCGEITRLEFHCNPALVGTLREVAVEISYDDAVEPSLRLPLTDLAGLPHPWPTGRWDTDNGTMAGGIRYPWYIHTPRIHFNEATVFLNLPLPFAKGLRVELVNRSDSMRFSGYTRAVIAPLSEREALAAGRLCAQRTVTPLAPGTAALPLLHLPGPGQLVSLGLFTSGSAAYPPSAQQNVTALTIDGEKPLTGPLVLPIWFNGAYGGGATSPLLNHARYEDRFAGVTRAYLTDPIPFNQGATFAFTPGPTAEGAPTDVIAFALWYSFAKTPYTAGPLPPRAETLPSSSWGVGPWLMEAEDLVPMCTAHGGEVRVMPDVAHDYNASGGSYLLYAADQPGDYLDCTLRLPASPYIAIGTATIWGPVRGLFEADLLSPAEAVNPPTFPQSDEFYRGRAVGGVPMLAPVQVGNSPSHRRDASIELLPFRNPAPDGDGVVRFICQTKPMDCATYLFALDRLQLATPPPAKGWRECEEGLPDTAGDLTATLPKYGRLDWSGWGAVTLNAPAGGTATVRALVFIGTAKGEVLLKGCLGPAQGGWNVRINGGAAMVLTPGKTAQEVVTWTLPTPGFTVPGPLLLEFTCTKAADPIPNLRITPNAELALDAWMIR